MIAYSSTFDFNLILRTAWQMLRGNLVFFLVIIFLIDVPLRMLPISLTPDFGADPTQIFNDWPRILVAGIVFSLIRLFPVTMYYRVVGDMMVGERRLLFSTLGRCLHRFPIVVIAAAMYGVAAFVGLLALIVPGIIVLIFGCCYAPAAVIRERGVIDSLTYSVNLVRGNFGNVFALQIGVFVGLLVINLLILGASAVFTMIGLQMVGQLGALFLLALVELFGLLVNAALFFNLEAIQRAKLGTMTTNAS